MKFTIIANMQYQCCNELRTYFPCLLFLTNTSTPSEIKSLKPHQACVQGISGEQLHYNIGTKIAPTGAKNLGIPDENKRPGPLDLATCIAKKAFAHNFSPHRHLAVLQHFISLYQSLSIIVNCAFMWFFQVLRNSVFKKRRKGGI